MIECQDVFSIILYSCLDMLTVNGTKTEYDEQSIIKMLNFFSPTELKTRKKHYRLYINIKNMKI